MIDASRVKIAGDDLLRVEDLSRRERDELFRALTDQGIWLEVVPGRSSLTVQFDSTHMLPDVAREKFASVRCSAGAGAEEDCTPLDLPVAYGGVHGPDLSAVCRALELSEEQLIRRHTEMVHRLDFLGFTPGFSYLYTEEDAGLDVPRLGSPRQRVEAGSIGIVGSTTGLYALAGPGGWPIIGRTPATVFDAGGQPPSRLKPGSAIRFRAISETEFDELNK